MSFLHRYTDLHLSYIDELPQFKVIIQQSMEIFTLFSEEYVHDDLITIYLSGKSTYT